MVRVMFVCLGNICRSPTAHGVFLAKVSAAGLQHEIEVCSSGTAGYHVGSPPDERSVDAARVRGVDLSGLRARQFNVSDFDRCDYVLAMDQSNLSFLEQLVPETFTGHLGLLLAFSGDDAGEVPDPYYGGKEGFRKVVDLIDEASVGLLDQIKRHHLRGGG